MSTTQHFVKSIWKPTSTTRHFVQYVWKPTSTTRHFVKIYMETYIIYPS